jgi:hypothetical protein
MVAHDQLRLFVFGRIIVSIESCRLHYSSSTSIIRAFLIEEQRIVAMVMKSKKLPGTTETPTTSQNSK